MFEQGSFRLNRVVKTCQAKVAAVSRRHAASFSSCRQYTKVGLGQGKTRKKLKTCLQNIATNTFSHRAHRRRCSEGSNNNHASTASSDTLFAHPPQAEEIPELKPQRTASPSISSAETAIDTTLQPRRQTPALNTQQVNIQKIPARYRARIRQLRSGAADMEDSSVEETKAGTKPGGLPRSSTSYRLSGLALRGNGSNIPLPSSSSTSFAHSTASSRRTSQQDRVSSGSHEKHPPRRSSIVQRHGHPATEQMPETTPSSCRGFSKGTVNNPTSATSVASATPQRQLMQPLGPPFPRSQTLAGPALCPNSTKPSERKAPLKVAWEEFEDNNTENGCGIRDVEDEETVKILKRTCLPKSEIEKERKWKLSSLERFGNKDRVETASELPAEGPPEGGWLWDQDDARLVSSIDCMLHSQPQVLTIAGQNSPATAILVGSLHHGLEQFPPRRFIR